jgi:uncharacterized protein (TIGR00645 family)
MTGKDIYRVLNGFRWIMLVFYGGLALALCGFALVFVYKLAGFFLAVPHLDEVDAMLKVLGLIDYALVAGLLVIVMLSGFSSFVEAPDEKDGEQWLSSIGFSAVKVKFASTIAAIGAINLLESALETGTLSSNNILLQSAVQLVLILVVLAFAFVDWMSKRMELR